MSTPSATDDVRFIEVQGERVPALGYGTWQLTGDECVTGVTHALGLGYRHIDTAQMYDNEEQVGRGLIDSGVDRDEIFLTTKIPPQHLRGDDVIASHEESLRKLGTDHVDLLLIHWPSDDVPLGETLAAMRSLQEQGKARHLGVSNFTPSLVREARSHATIFCNQVEYHPFLDQSTLLREVRDEGILFTAYSPLARGRVTDDDVIGEIARIHDRTPAQVTLRWILQQGVSPIPKASSAAHREGNLGALEFALTDDEMARISALGSREGRLIDPDFAPDWED